MDTIEFRSRPDSDARRDVVDVLINGRSLIELISDYERPHAEAAGRSEAAGHYVGLDVTKVAPPSRLLLGEPDGWFCCHPGIVTLLTCTCGELGCGSVNCFIAANDERVVWSEFRGDLGPMGSDGRRRESYAGFGPFEFDRNQYESALTELASGPTP